MDTTLPIEYSGFYDAPLAFRVWHDDGWYYFWRGYFDEEADDYPSVYEVFRVEGSRTDKPCNGWDLADYDPKQFVGRLSMKQVLFDESKRNSINARTFSLISHGKTRDR
jgi:hypothetical protein